MINVGGFDFDKEKIRDIVALLHAFLDEMPFAQLEKRLQDRLGSETRYENIRNRLSKTLDTERMQKLIEEGMGYEVGAGFIAQLEKTRLIQNKKDYEQTDSIDDECGAIREGHWQLLL